MKQILITFFILTTCTGFSQDSEWNYLFDGKTLNGWHEYNGDKISENWYVDNGELVFKAPEDNLSRGQDIITDRTFTNFELSLEWKISKGGNSGVFFKVVEIPEVDAPWKTGPEIQVLDNENFDANRWHKAPALYDLKPIRRVKYNKYGEWNHLVLRVDHDKNIGSITFNGQIVYDFPLHGPEWDKMVGRSKFNGDSYFEDLTPEHTFFTYAPFFGKFKTGSIGLQDHGASVRYRNIKIKEL